MTYENLQCLIIGISGKIGVGKDYMARHILENSKKAIILAFADSLKLMVLAENKDVPYNDVFIKKTEVSRKLLQDKGTYYRQHFHPNYWIDLLYNTIKLHCSRGFDTFIISDVRYKNEAAFIKEIGGYIIRITAPERNLTRLKSESSKQYDKIRNHKSETDLDDYKFEYVVTNDFDNQKESITQMDEALKTIRNDYLLTYV